MTEYYSHIGNRKTQGTANISKSCILKNDRLRKPRLEPDRVIHRRTKSGSFRTGRCRADVRERSFIATSCLSRPRKSRQRMIKKSKKFSGLVTGSRASRLLSLLEANPAWIAW